jgi:hypothetical protein
MQYGRYQDFAGGVYQVVDDERYMLIDSVTGEPLRKPVGSVFYSKEEVLTYMLKSPQGPIRHVAVRLDCIASLRIE